MGFYEELIVISKPSDSLAAGAAALPRPPLELSIVVTMKYGQQQIEIHQARLPCSLKSIFNSGASVMAVAGWGMLGLRISQVVWKCMWRGKTKPCLCASLYFFESQIYGHGQGGGILHIWQQSTPLPPLFSHVKVFWLSAGKLSSREREQKSKVYLQGWILLCASGRQEQKIFIKVCWKRKSASAYSGRAPCLAPGHSYGTKPLLNCFQMEPLIETEVKKTKNKIK